MSKMLLPFIFAIHLLFGLPACTLALTAPLQETGPLLFALRTNTQSAEMAVVKKIRHSHNSDRTRIVIDLNRPVAYTVSRQNESRTIIVELAQAQLGRGFTTGSGSSLNGSLIHAVEAKENGKGTVEVSLRYKRLGSHKLLLLTKPDRLVVDLYPPTGSPTALDIGTIVIDPGHGGKDPGATSPNGLQEKDVVLDVSRRLKNLIEKRLNKKVIMTRDRDVFIPLKERTQIANDNHADLFVSVHVNSSPLRNTQGIEVYLLGRASDPAASATAARENAASDEGAFDFQQMILNDLEREFTLNASLELAHFTHEAIVKNLISKYPTPALGVKKAPFYVLAHTEMPAILAEISFLSNRTEEKRLRRADYRQAAAEALYNGVEAYIRSLKSGL